jgi:hypothetical protein
VLTLPDQSRAHVPAEWTDIHGSSSAPAISTALGSMDDLLRARSIVDALVNRRVFNTAADIHPDKERQRATESGISNSSRTT